MQTILAIDQSTSATKALLFEPSGRLLDKASLEHRQIYPQPGYVEHDAEEIWQNTLAAVKSLLKRKGDAGADVAHVSVTNQRETIVIFDRRTGKPLHNAVVWQCRRGEGICAELKAAGHDESVARKTGLKIDTYFSASKLTWLIRSRPDLAAKLASGDALIGTIDAYLTYRLTSGRVFATDHTNASRTLLLDIQTLRWDDELCHLFNVPRRALPELRDSTGRFGETDFGSILPRRVPICGVMGDSQASLFAHRCFTPGTAKVTLGSGSSVLLNIGSALRPPGTGAVATIAWTHSGAATYALEGIINYAAATLGWLKDQLGLIANVDEAEAAATSVPDNGGVYLVPAFGGLSAPHWSAGARAAIVGLTAYANRCHVVRAALESIAYQLRDVLDMMRGRAELDLGTINADGGATRNAFLMQFIADITGREIAVAQVAECSPLGAALAGSVGMGLHASLDAVAALPRDVVTYSPRMAPTQAQRLYEGWARAVRQVLAGASEGPDEHRLK
jgi:glycerol kinase